MYSELKLKINVYIFPMPNDKEEATVHTDLNWSKLAPSERKLLDKISMGIKKEKKLLEGRSTKKRSCSL